MVAIISITATVAPPSPFLERRTSTGFARWLASRIDTRISNLTLKVPLFAHFLSKSEKSEIQAKSPKAAWIVAFGLGISGGASGTRTPDLRIMIPSL